MGAITLPSCPDRQCDGGMWRSQCIECGKHSGYWEDQKIYVGVPLVVTCSSKDRASLVSQIQSDEIISPEMSQELGVMLALSDKHDGDWGLVRFELERRATARSKLLASTIAWAMDQPSYERSE